MTRAPRRGGVRMYDRDQVEDLLTLRFDPLRFYGPTGNVLPDDDMPKSASSPAHGGTWMAELADIDRAWRLAELSETQRRRMFLRFGLDLSCEAVAAFEDVSTVAVYKTTDSGVEAILNFLNGTTPKELV